jgi:hypothetical protein
VSGSVPLKVAGAPTHVYDMLGGGYSQNERCSQKKTVEGFGSDIANTSARCALS